MVILQSDFRCFSRGHDPFTHAHGPDAQHMLDPSSMVVVIVIVISQLELWCVRGRRADSSAMSMKSTADVSRLRTRKVAVKERQVVTSTLCSDEAWLQCSNSLTG